MTQARIFLKLELVNTVAVDGSVPYTTMASVELASVVHYWTKVYRFFSFLKAAILCLGKTVITTLICNYEFR